MKKIRALDVVSESYSKLFGYVKLMGVFWLLLIPHLMMNASHDPVVVVLGIILLLLGTVSAGVLVIRLCLKNEKVDFGSFFGAMKQMYYWRYIGVLMLGSLAVAALTIVAMVLGFIGALSDSGFISGLFYLVVAVAGIWALIFISSVFSIALAHAAMSGTRSVSFSWNHVKSLYFRFFGGHILASLPTIIVTVMISMYQTYHFGLMDGMSMIFFAALSVVNIFFSLLPVIYAAFFYRDLIDQSKSHEKKHVKRHKEK